MRFALCLFVLLASLGPSRAAEETAVFRVIGLSHREREADFRDAVATVSGLTVAGLDFDKAEATLKFDPEKIVPNTKAGQPVPPEKVLDSIDKLIAQASTRTFTITARTGKAEDLTKHDIPVGILDCKGCRYGAYLAIAKIEGVDRASISDQSIVTAWIDPKKTDRAALISALKKARVDVPESGSPPF